jgi:hypothetical protein
MENRMYLIDEERRILEGKKSQPFPQPSSSRIGNENNL